MLDWTTCKIPCVHTPIPTSEFIRVSPAGEIEYSFKGRTKVTGTYDASITIRSQGTFSDGKVDTLHVSGNFAKFLQGHNIIGSSNLIQLTIDSLKKLCDILSEEEGIHLCESIDWFKVCSGDFEVDRIDINHLYSLPSRSDVNAWLRAAEFTSHTRHGRPVNSRGTVYWGKNSRRWSLKAYCKADEIESSGDHKLPAVEKFEPLREFIQDKLRIELTLRQLELRKLGITYAKQLDFNTIDQLYSSYLGRLEMSEKILLNDEQALKLPRASASTYHMWKMGMQPYDMLPKNTFYRHRRQLLEFGIDISNPPPVTVSNVVPLVRVLEAKPVSIPDWAYEQGLISAA